jgi:hypothetical protein
MKNSSLIVLYTFCSVALSSSGQGVLIYDQQSNTNESHLLPGSGGTIQDATPPWGQSFTPSLSGIGFIRLALSDGNASSSTGAVVYVNLIAGSIGGTVISSTAPVAMPGNFAGFPTFFFPTNIPVTPGTTYYFTPVVQSGGRWDILSDMYNYTGGSGWNAGSPVLASDLWFREGVVTPEPSSAGLLSVGVGLFLLARQRSRLRHRQH